MVCNRFVYQVHKDFTTFALRLYYVLQGHITSLPRPYYILIPPRPRYVSSEHVQNLIKTFMSIKTSLRPYYVPPTSYKTVPRPYGVLNCLGRSKDVVRMWPSVDVLTNVVRHSPNVSRLSYDRK